MQTLALEHALEEGSILATRVNKAAGAMSALSTLLEDQDQDEGLPSRRYPGDSARRESPSMDEAWSRAGVVPAAGMKGRVSFDHVSFSYPGRPGARVLDDLNLEVPAGKTVALVGRSGAGKSTVAQLLLRFYRPDSGAVSIDGLNAADLDVRWLRRNMAVVPQSPALFAASIRDNIRYGRLDASDAEVEDAARRAMCDFAWELPRGLDTVLAEGGGSLSGGQRQRIAIARALLRDPRVLILDEATSALDAHSERAVHEALRNAAQGRTVLVIAHRLSTVRLADSIAVVDHGRVVEQGTHSELLRAGGAYASLVHRQREGASEQELIDDQIPPS